MNKDEVIALAEKCKLAVLIHSQWTAEIKEFTVVDYVVEGDLGSLMQFADLVASAERRNCVDTLSFHGEMSKDDDPEWAEVAFWCCSRINNPIPTDKTFAVNYKEIDNARGQA